MTNADTPPATEPERHRVFAGQAVRFLIVGLVSYAVDLGLLTLLSHAGVPLPVAAAAGWATGFGVNFTLNRAWAFESDASLRGSLVRYVALAAANFVVTVTAVPALAWAGMDLAIAKTLIVAVLAACNFVIYRLWVFGPRAA